MKKCPYCAEEIQEEAVKCRYCGESISIVTVTKQNSNVVLNTDINIRHGTAISTRSQNTAFILCLFFGWLGLHRFYVGRIGSGFLYMFTFGAFGIGWILDLIMIAMGSFKDSFGYFVSSN